MIEARSRTADIPLHIQQSFDDVAAVFQDSVYHDPPGGNNFPRRTLHNPGEFIHKNGSQGRIADDYHAESSFTDPERPYIYTVCELLRQIADEEYIEDYMYMLFRSMEEPKDFGTVVTEAITHVMETFSQKYPNLMPAFHRLLGQTGIEGYMTTITYASKLVELTASNNQEAINNLFSRATSKHTITAIHPNEGYTEEQRGEVHAYEVLCLGISTAVPILRKSAIAAEMITGDSTAMKGYRGEIDPSFSQRRNRLQSCESMLWEEALKRQTYRTSDTSSVTPLKEATVAV